MMKYMSKKEEVSKSRVINEEQIQLVLTEFYKANVGVQNFEALKKFFDELPETK